MVVNFKLDKLRGHCSGHGCGIDDKRGCAISYCHLSIPPPPPAPVWRMIRRLSVPEGQKSSQSNLYDIIGLRRNGGRSSVFCWLTTFHHRPDQLRSVRQTMGQLDWVGRSPAPEADPRRRAAAGACMNADCDSVGHCTFIRTVR